MKHKPVVVYIITKLELGGAQKICLSLFNELKKENSKTFLISGDTGYLAQKLSKRNGVILLPSLEREVSSFKLFNEINAFFYLITILRNLRKKHPTLIVHTHSTKAGLLGRWAAFFAGVKKRIHTIHGFAFHDYQPWFVWWPIYLLELLTSLITTHFVCVSSVDAKNGIKLFPQFSQKHSIIRAAVDTTQFIPAKKISSFAVYNQANKKNEFIFGTIACFKPQKNLFDLLHAFKQVHATCEHVRLEIIGDGSLRNKIETWIAQNQLSKAITLHGWQDQVGPIMINWHAFVLSSLWEGLPCAVVEARLLKLPVISYDTGGIHDVIIHNENGLLVPQKQLRLLAQEMNHLVVNKKLQNKFCAYHDDLEDFDLSAMVKAHKQLYCKEFP